MESTAVQRQRVQDDLRGLIAGDVRCDDCFVQLYASDGSVYEIRPLGVVRPRSAADVVTCVQYAAQRQIPLHARGAGSGVAGESLGAGLIIDFSKYLRRIIRTDAEAVRVQAGVVHQQLNQHLRAHGRIFGPDPSTSAVTTVGGMIAVDAAGSRRIKYGSTRQHVLRLQVVLADGQLLELGREALTPAPEEAFHPRRRELVDRVAALLQQHAEPIRRYRETRRVRAAGYDFCDVLTDTHLDLARLLVGSEGTLALITEATLATQPLPRQRAVALLLFDSLEAAGRTSQEIAHHAPSACDLMDRRHLTLVREANPRFDQLIPRETEAVLLVEQEGDDASEVRQRLQALTDEVRQNNHRVLAARQAFDVAETELFWELANRFQPAFFRLKGPTRAVPVVEDMAVPPAALPEFLTCVQNVLKRHEITASVFAHAAHGQVHLRPFLDLQHTSSDRMRALADDLYREVFAAGGAPGGENACGLSRTAYLETQYGELYPLVRQLKQLFDPENRFNPGKIVGDGAAQLTENLRPPVVSVQRYETPADASSDQPGLRNLVELQLNWDPAAVADAADACNGCGECRTQEHRTRMCPIFRFAPSEEASPRAKANLMRGVLTGRLDVSTLKSESFKAIADLCVHCHSCRRECPAAVDVPRLMREAKAAYMAANGLTAGDWIMTHLDTLVGLGAVVRRLSNWAIGHRRMRWLMEKLLGIAQGRKLPRIAAKSFLRRAQRRRLVRPSRRSGRKVVYFVDHYANYHDPQLAEALVAVFEHNGIEVYVHPGQRQSGMPAIALGALDHARALAAHNVRILAEAVRQGYHIVSAEPTAVLCLTREYPQILDDPDAELVAKNASEACAYLWRMHTLGSMQLDLRPVHTTLGYHAPCHLLALETGLPGKELLSLVPGLHVTHVEEGCSGMAGTFGLRRENYRSSLRAGWGLIARLRDPAILAGVTECSTCKVQMEQGTTKPTIHPLKVLALAYGLMPEIAGLLTTPGEELIVT